MDFEAMKDGCPWISVELKDTDEQIETCLACGGPCVDSNCAPFHWIIELKDQLWVDITAQIGVY